MTKITSTYDSIADWYEEWLGGTNEISHDPFATPLFDLIGDVAGRRICDLGCGQGRVTRYLARQGAEVVGVDASAAMLEIATHYPIIDQLEYRHDDAHTLASCRDAEFDGVVCNMALMDIPDLTAAIASVHRVLRPGGWFAFATFHPCFNAPLSAELVDDAGRSHRTVTGYFHEGHWQSDQRIGPPGKVGAHHRTLTTYQNTLINTGFTIRQVQELSAQTPCWQEVPPVIAMIVDRPARN